MDESLRLIDLVPRRLTTFALLLLAGLAVVAGLEMLYAWSTTSAMAEITTDGRVAAFDLDGEGSLAVWFSSATLAAAALAAVLVYTVRRHKTDDYQGYYRVWVWAAMCWVLMSVDEASSLHEGFKEMMVRVTGLSPGLDGSIWWVAPYFFLLGAVGSRLLVDMRHCRLSSGALLVTAGCYALAVVTQLQWILPDSGARGVMLEEGAEMVGNVFLLLAMGLHARYVILDAEGLLPQRASDSDDEYEEEYEEEATEAEAWIEVDLAHPTPGPAHRRKRKQKAKTSVVHPAFRDDLGTESESESVSSPVNRRLTKQEKKALRKRLMRERTARQRKQRGKWS